MPYVSLRKLYYGDEESYSEAYNMRFNGIASVKLDFQINKRQAFFVQCDDVVQRMYQILRLDKQVKELLIRLPGIAAEQYRRKCLIDEIVLSNKIEGVHSSRREIDEVLSELEQKSEAKGKKKRFKGIVNKYQKLLAHEEVPLETCQNIRSLYDELVLDEVVAENPHNAPDGKIFRKDMTEVKSATDRVVHKGVYPEAAIIDRMNRALSFLHDDSIEALYRICVFHYMLEYIHPFYDGNGRLGRFIVSHYLSRELEDILAVRLSETIARSINAYYDAFETCNDPHNLGDLTPFLIMMLEMVLESAKDLKDSLERKNISLRKYQYALMGVPNLEKKNVEKLYNVLLQAALFSENGISTKELEAVSGLKYGGIRNLLGYIQKDLLISATLGREKYYRLDLRKLDEQILPGSEYSDDAISDEKETDG